ncbi:MAG: tRNA pseudouridine(55) synthase TruB [Acidobacteria bacterium]|nr:tRNA pseudouridine(55) synthase TruB [Acidobacteriota bacterium]
MIDGILLIDKPVGWTSHDVVARVRRVLREKRVGHTGTLDPFATGVLVVLAGRATRLAQFLAGAEKEYEATIRLGFATVTGDLTGAPREREPGATSCAALDETRIEAALSTLRGEIEQVPPMYSAKKVQGQKLYELARRGEEIERRAVRVTVSVFEVLHDADVAWLHGNEDGTCDLRVRVVCSAGTYVRVLAEEVGVQLGTGAHLAALRRTRAGEFRIEDSLELEDLARMVENGAISGELVSSRALISMDAALPGMPFVHLTGDEARRVRHGAAVRASNAPPNLKDGEFVKLRDEDGGLLAVGIFSAANGLLQPRVMLTVEK